MAVVIEDLVRLEEVAVPDDLLRHIIAVIERYRGVYEQTTGKRLSDEELAKQAGLRRQTVNSFLNGHTYPQPKNLFRLCRVLKIPLHELDIDTPLHNPALLAIMALLEHASEDFLAGMLLTLKEHVRLKTKNDCREAKRSDCA